MGRGWQWQCVAIAMMVLSRAGGDQPLESDLVDAGAWHVGENVQAAIAHYGERVGRADGQRRGVSPSAIRPGAA